MSDEQNPPAVEPAAQPATPVPVAVFDAADKRFKTVSLQWPFSYEGKHYDSIVIRRLTQGAVAAFVARINAEKQANTEAEVRFPIYADTDGNSLSDAVMACLDDDDALAVDEAARDFLPRRFQPAS